ncbi:MAG TPA: tryptophan-rich sensory protein [Flavipsychrobacter sp.]|nr:tryptophan-rich sensory protein [Flavipsychrobacter sp.]
MTKTNILKLIVALALPLLLGAIAGSYTSEEVPNWYRTLKAPSFAPPGWLFGPVWSTLYILMGISSFLVWKQKATPLRNKALVIYLVQLLLNFAWSFIFFYYKEIGWALVEIVILWIAILLFLWHFYRIKPVAAYLNIPYFLWVSFATALTAGYWMLN